MITERQQIKELVRKQRQTWEHYKNKVFLSGQKFEHPIRSVKAKMTLNETHAKKGLHCSTIILLN